MSYRTLKRTTGLLALAAVSLAARCDDSGPLQVRENAFVWTGVVAPGKAVRLRQFQGGIEVVPTASDTVRVTARVEWRRGDPDALDFSGVSQDGDALICAVWPGGNCSKDDYNASIRMGRRGNRTDAKVYFRVEVPTGVQLDLVNINGDIKVAASAPVFARTVSGDVMVATAVGPVAAETVNGSVDIRMSTLGDTGTISAETVNGSAYVYVPEASDIALDLSVMNGTVSTDFPVMVQGETSRRHLTANIGAGTRPVRAKTMNGDAALRKLAPVAQQAASPAARP